MIAQAVIIPAGLGNAGLIGFGRLGDFAFGDKAQDFWIRQLHDPPPMLSGPRSFKTLSSQPAFISGTELSKSSV